MRRFNPSFISRYPVVWVLILVGSQLLQGCDNPACVFGPEGCQSTDDGVGGGGGSEELIADPPQDGEMLSPDAPQITAFFPGDEAHPDTPIVLIFSESMAPEGIEDAFELVHVSSDPNIPEIPLGTLPGTLVGEGRVAILTTLEFSFFTPLINGESYRLDMVQGAKLFDRTGQALNLGTTSSVGSFRVATTSGVTPKLLTMWPQEGTEGQSTMPQIVAVFDQMMDFGSVNAPDAFSVTVNGSSPTNHPDPEMLSISSVGSIPQVFTWRSFEADGEPALLGTDSTVTLDLASTIQTEGNTTYPGSSTSFVTAAMNPPAEVAVTSSPTHAFGVDHVNGTTPIEVTVTLEGPANAGDTLTLYEYGTSYETGNLSLLSRDVAIPEGATEAILGESQLDLVDDSFSARFADGDVYIAVSQRNGSVSTPVRVLDTDLDQSGDQPAVLDTVAPTLLGLGVDGSLTTEYVSTTSNVSVTGVADEELAAVEVEVLIDSVTHTNGELASVVGTNSTSGSFIAAPIQLGIVDPATLPGDMTVTIYDRAMNSAAPLDVTWRQVGASGPGASLPGGGNVTVRVFDAVTHTLVDDALVISHEVDVVETFLGSDLTDLSGVSLVPSAASGDTVVTVDAVGYDLFTFHGVPTTRLDVPLQPILSGSGELQYVLLPSPLSTPDLLFGFDKYIADDRMTAGPVRAATAAECPGDSGCSFEVEIMARRFGVATALVTAEQSEQDLLTWLFDDSGPKNFLKVVQPDFLTAAAPDSALITTFMIDNFLDDASVDAEEQPIEGPLVQFDTSGFQVLDDGDLEGGRPQVFVEAVVPGTTQRMTVGAGHAFFNTVDWFVVSAYAGAADGISDGSGDLLGRWVTDGMIEEDLFLRVDAIDAAGNSSGRRVSFSALSTMSPPSLIPTNVPALIEPATNTGGSDFKLNFSNTLDDSLNGMYKVRLTNDATGRSWDVWHLDEPGSTGRITAHVPEIASHGGQPLNDGALSVVVSLRGLPAADLDVSSFLWSEVDAKADVRAHTATLVLQQP